MTRPRPPVRTAGRAALAGLLVTVGLVAAATTAAHAHVEAEEPAVGPDGAATVEFSFDHGCDGQPTTSLRVQIPSGVTEVVPEPKDGWQVQVTDTEFGWSGGSIPDAEAATFRATMRVSGEAGTTIYFPTLQGCPTAELAWIEEPEPGAPEPEDIAPSVTLTETVAPPATTATPSTAPPSTTTTTSVGGELAAATTEEPDSPENAAGRVVIIVIVVVIIGTGVVLYLRYRGTGRK